jgi:LacI family transcriptional regulator
MKKKADKVYKVWVHLRLSYASGRDLLYGISNYARSNAHWRIILHPFSGESANPPFPRPGEADGIITSEPLDGMASSSGIPLVVIGTRERWLGRRMKSLVFVRNDDMDIGSMGARTLKALGKFASFGFVGTNTPYYCSILRGEGFQKELASMKSVPVLAFGNVPGRADGSPEDLDALCRWLVKLPKPTAVMAVHDLRATHVLTAAAMRNIGPKQLAVIGVDNDELLCDFTEPRLTSIAPNHVKEGEIAAAALNRMLKSGNAAKCPLHTRTIRSSSKTLVERDSTRLLGSSLSLSKSAMDYIRRNAFKGISPADVAIALHASRRLCDLRFRECYGESMLEAILRIRLAEIMRKLRSTAAPIGRITAACGFSCASYAKRLFRKRLGLTMRDYRAQSSQR